MWSGRRSSRAAGASSARCSSLCPSSSSASGRAEPAPRSPKLWLVAAALLIGLALGNEWGGLWMVGLLVAQILLVSFGRGRERWLPIELSPAPALVALAALGAVPWLLHAWRIAGLADSVVVPHDTTTDVDHYPVQAAFAIALVMLPAAAGLWGRRRRLMAASAGLSGLYFSLLCLARRTRPRSSIVGGPSPGWCGRWRC